MMKRIVLATLLATFTSWSVAGQGTAAATVPTDSEIQKILAERIDTQQQGVGIVVGIIDGSTRRVVAHGTFNDDDRHVDGDTIFEIGSTTKVFTALLLADAVGRGEVALEDPIAKYLPADVKVPERGGKKITLLDLATHTSGLPRLPSNLAPSNMENPYADYTVKQLHAFLSSYKLSRDIGSQYEYSNFGAGLLGHILSLRARTDYETLVRTRITEPLKMQSTAIALGDSLRPRLATGHDAQRKSVPNWDLPSLAGAGAIRSSANDMLNLLAAALSPESPLSATVATTLKTRRDTNMPGLAIGLGWHISTRTDREIVWHNGGTGGYRSFIGFDPKRHLGVAVLANMFTDIGVDDIGQHLLDASVPLASAPKVRTEIPIDAKVLEHYVGLYELAPNFILTVTRDGNRLFTQATGQPRVEVFAESPREFFLKVTDVQITFLPDESGRASALILHQAGRDMKAKRIEAEIPVPKERTAIALGTEVLDRYTGQYRLAPDFVIAITRQGAQLFLQATGQPKAGIFAENEHEFFLTVVDAQVTFVNEGNGRATKMILQQNGMDMPGERVK